MKNFFYIILFLPFISIGQNDVTPKIACDLITDYERAKEFTLKYLNTMPADKYSYKPTPEILSFREEALHLAGGNYRYAAMIAGCLLYTSPSPRDSNLSRMPSSA